MAEQIYNIIYEQILSGFNSIYKNVLLQNQNKRYLLRELQQQLKMIPKWTNIMIQRETQRIIITSKCQFLEDILQDQIRQSYKRINFEENCVIKKMPLTHIIYRVYMYVGREIYKKPQLLYHDYSPEKLSLCREELKQLILMAVEVCIDDFISDNKNIQIIYPEEEEEEEESVQERVEEQEEELVGEEVEEKVLETVEQQSENGSSTTDGDIKEVQEEREIEEEDQESVQSFGKQLHFNQQQFEENEFLDSEDEEEMEEVEEEVEEETEQEPEQTVEDQSSMTKTINIVYPKTQQQKVFVQETDIEPEPEVVKTVEIEETKEQVFEKNNSDHIIDNMLETVEDDFEENEEQNEEEEDFNKDLDDLIRQIEASA